MTTFQQKHGRPRPPAKIWCGGDVRESYERDNPQVVSVYYSRWTERWEVAMNNESRTFDTHAEAITWAQKHARQ